MTWDEKGLNAGKRHGDETGYKANCCFASNSVWIGGRYTH